MSTESEILILREQLEELKATLDRWRDHMAWQEELAAYEASLEEFARRLFALEKRVARQKAGEAVRIQIAESVPPAPSEGTDAMAA